MEITKDDVVAVIRVVAAVGAAIRDAGQVPSGHLYSEVCGHLTANQYQQIIDKLKQAKLIRSEGHLLIWVGEAQ